MTLESVKIGASGSGPTHTASPQSQSGQRARTQIVRYLTLARGSNHSRNPGGIV